MYKKLSKTSWIIVVLATVVVISVVKFTFVKEEPAPEAQVSATPLPKETPRPVKASAPSPELYTKVLKDYENGYRIQFDAGCQAIPKNVTYKNGTKIMLDNRSGDARVISVGGTSYNLAGYGYKIVTLSSSVLPKTLFLNCGTAVNVGQILLQK